jgi:oligoribonuclease NrnB/cAMP/cGMP phosphodiesterase (DHH superfamily)
MAKKRLGYFHNKDMDGYFSGAVLKYKYPDIELRGWDYKDSVPGYDEMMDFDEVILIDITFPLDILLQISSESKDPKFTVIDHHISFKRQADDYLAVGGELSFEYIFDDKLSACELGMKHYFGYIPPIVELAGKYDTWRANGTPEWESSVLPMKYFLYGCVNKPEDVNTEWFISEEDFEDGEYEMMNGMIKTGKAIMSYERTMDEARTKSYAFETEAYGGLKALCINTNFMSSETMISRFDSTKHDIQIGFAWNGTGWGISLRSIEGGADASIIARERGGGGHKGAAGYQVQNFEDIFK